MELNEISFNVNATLSYYVRLQELTALNVANVSNEGYVPKELNFEEFLSNLNKTMDVKQSLELATFTSSDNSIDLDNQVAQSELNSMRFSELTEVFNRYLSLYNTALNKGR